MDIVMVKPTQALIDARKMIMSLNGLVWSSDFWGLESSEQYEILRQKVDAIDKQIDDNVRLADFVFFPEDDRLQILRDRAQAIKDSVAASGCPLEGCMVASPTDEPSCAAGVTEADLDVLNAMADGEVVECDAVERQHIRLAVQELAAFREGAINGN